VTTCRRSIVRSHDSATDLDLAPPPACRVLLLELVDRQHCHRRPELVVQHALQRQPAAALRRRRRPLDPHQVELHRAEPFPPFSSFPPGSHLLPLSRSLCTAPALRPSALLASPGPTFTTPALVTSPRNRNRIALAFDLTCFHLIAALRRRSSHPVKLLISDGRSSRHRSSPSIRLVVALHV
jgi:hypothetical protein